MLYSNSDYYTEEQAAFSTMTQFRACGLKFRVWNAGFTVCCEGFGLRFQAVKAQGKKETLNPKPSPSGSGSSVQGLGF